MWQRRTILKSGGLALVGLGLGTIPSFLSRAVAQSPSRTPSAGRGILVVIFQRGGMDGLMAVPPLTDPNLVRLRPQLVPAAGQGKEGLQDLDGRFGLHPALSPLIPLYKSGNLAIVHGVGLSTTTRSHFDAQDYMETGTPERKSTRSGWLNRALQAAGRPGGEFQAVSLTPNLPRSLGGSRPVMALGNLDDLAQRSGRVLQTAGPSFESLYDQTSQQLLRQTGRESLEMARLITHLARQPQAEGYPPTNLGRSLRQIAQLIKAGVGLEVAFAESHGWDTHVRQANSFMGPARDLALSLRAFWNDMASQRQWLVVVTMTEFGRTVAQNGNAGTDHGRGSCFFVLGEPVAGGRVYGSVPRLEREALADRRDLPVTTDFRAVLAGTAGPILGWGQSSQVFPGWQGNPLPVLRA